MSEVEFTHNPTFPTTGGNTELHTAVLEGKLNSAEEALRKKPELLAIKNAHGDTPLHLAARACQVNMVQHFVSHASSSSLSPEELVRQMNNVGNTALHEAALNDCLQVIVDLLSVAPSASALVASSNGASALYLAAARCSTGIVRELLKIEGASCEGPNGQTALHVAVSRLSYDMADSLVKMRPTLLTRADKKGNTPLHLAAMYGYCTMVQHLLNGDVSAVYLPDTDWLTPIHVATKYGHLSVVQCLINKCPDCVELVDNNGWNFLHVAIKEAVVSVVDHVLASATLIKRVNVPDKKGNTPMHLAVRFWNMTAVEQLLSRAEFVTSALNHEGATAFDVALYTNISAPPGVVKPMSPSPSVAVPYTITAHGNITRRMMELMEYTSFEFIDPLSFSPQRLKEILFHLTRPPHMEAIADKSAVKHLSVVAVLIATATYAAAFALPGGYQSDQGQDPGTAWLTKRAAFNAFLVFDTFAMIISLLVTLTVGRPLRPYDHIYAVGWLRYAIVAFMLAFACGVYVVIADKRLSLAILICLMVLAPLAFRKVRDLPSDVQTILRFCCSRNDISHAFINTGILHPLSPALFYFSESSPFRCIYDKMVVYRLGPIRFGKFDVAWDITQPGLWGFSITQRMPCNS